MYVCKYVCMYVCICVHITHTHAHTHTHTLFQYMFIYGHTEGVHKKVHTHTLRSTFRNHTHAHTYITLTQTHKHHHRVIINQRTAEIARFRSIHNIDEHAQSTLLAHVCSPQKNGEKNDKKSQHRKHRQMTCCGHECTRAKQKFETPTRKARGT